MVVVESDEGCGVRGVGAADRKKLDTGRHGKEQVGKRTVTIGREGGTHQRRLRLLVKHVRVHEPRLEGLAVHNL